MDEKVQTVCECGREWNATDYHYARCTGCKKHIPADIVIQAWRR